MIKTIKRSKDINGNTLARVVCDDGTFSVQTNENLPEIHRGFVWNGQKESGNTSEVSAWVETHGTARQKALLKA